MSAPRLRLTGYRLSVYTRSVRMVLAAKGVACDYVECDPFEAAGRAALVQRHPFGRVPVLEAGAFRLWETQAILDYLEDTAPEPALRPEGAQARARMRQVMGVADNYLYWPLVRQAFAHGVLAPLEGREADLGKVAAGLAAAPAILDALEEIAAEGLVLRPGTLCLSGCHLWPMLDYFAMVSEGAAMLARRAALSDWAGAMASRAEARATRPVLRKEAMT